MIVTLNKQESSSVINKCQSKKAAPELKVRNHKNIFCTQKYLKVKISNILSLVQEYILWNFVIYENVKKFLPVLG